MGDKFHDLSNLVYQDDDDDDEDDDIEDLEELETSISSFLRPAALVATQQQQQHLRLTEHSRRSNSLYPSTDDETSSCMSELSVEEIFETASRGSSRRSQLSCRSCCSITASIISGQQQQQRQPQLTLSPGTCGSHLVRTPNRQQYRSLSSDVFPSLLNTTSSPRLQENHQRPTQQTPQQTLPQQQQHPEPQQQQPEPQQQQSQQLEPERPVPVPAPTRFKRAVTVAACNSSGTQPPPPMPGHLRAFFVAKHHHGRNSDADDCYHASMAAAAAAREEGFEDDNVVDVAESIPPPTSRQNRSASASCLVRPSTHHDSHNSSLANYLESHGRAAVASVITPSSREDGPLSPTVLSQRASHFDIPSQHTSMPYEMIPDVNQMSDGALAMYEQCYELAAASGRAAVEEEDADRTVAAAAAPATASSSQVAVAAPIEIEIAPGEFRQLRGAEETMWALQQGRYQVVDCMNCSSCLQCIDNCELVICPDCRMVSPIVLADENNEEEFRGLSDQVDTVDFKVGPVRNREDEDDFDLLQEEDGLLEALSNHHKYKGPAAYLPMPYRQQNQQKRQSRHGVGLGFKL